MLWLRHLVQVNVIFECRDYLSYISHQSHLKRAFPNRKFTIDGDCLDPESTARIAIATLETAAADLNL